MANIEKDYIVSENKQFDFDDLVRIEVGATLDWPKSFTVHAGVLAPRSAFFKKALSGDWKEAKERIVRLPDDEAGIFSLYLHYLYKDEMPVEPHPLPLEHDGTETVLKLAKLYVLAEKLMDIETKNAVMIAMISGIYKPGYDDAWRTPNSQHIRVIYGGTPSTSPMRRLLVDVFAHHAKADHIPHMTRWPEEFLYELLCATLEQRAVIKPGQPGKKDGGLAYMEVKVKEAN